MAGGTREFRSRKARLLSIGGLLALAQSGQGCAKEVVSSRTDTAALAASGGVRADSGAVPMRVSDLPLTRQRVEDWRGAQRALSAVPDDTTFVPVRANDEVPSTEVDRAVAYLSSRPDSRRAIEQSGLSVRDYVLTALALERAEQARLLPAGAAGQALPPGNLDLVTEYGDDLRRARGSSGLHIVEYDDDADDVKDRHDRGDRDRGERRGHGHHGKRKDSGRHH